jgi:hypothetical protein
MRLPLLAAALCLSLAFLPAPATASSAVCVPPGTLNQLCVGQTGHGVCAWTTGPNPIEACLPDIALGGIVCVPPGSLNQVCVGFVGDGSLCALMGGGPTYAYLCVAPDGRVSSCSNSLYSVLYGPGDHCLGEPMP